MSSGFQKVFSMMLAVVIVATSCNNDDEFDPGTPPDIPPITTMVMDVDDFTQGNTSEAFPVNGKVMSKLNWSGAALQVGFWSTILALNMALPVASFAAAISETPVYDRERELWVWTYAHSFVGRTYTSELTGKVSSSQVEWAMTISEESGFQDVLWYTGTMMLDGSSGSWVLRKDANDPKDYLSITWVKENEEVGSIRYEVIETGVAEIGSYIEYGRLSGGVYNVFYNVVITSTQKSAYIEWNDETGAGRVEYNDSGEYLCWDTNFDDVACE